MAHLTARPIEQRLGDGSTVWNVEITEWCASEGDPKVTIPCVSYRDCQHLLAALASCALIKVEF